jgi:hypothetical protein
MSIIVVALRLRAVRGRPVVLDWPWLLAPYDIALDANVVSRDRKLPAVNYFVGGVLLAHLIPPKISV